MTEPALPSEDPETLRAEVSFYIGWASRGRRYEDIYAQLGLSEEQGLAVRGAGGRKHVAYEALRHAARIAREELPLPLVERGLFGFHGPAAWLMEKRGGREEIMRHAGFYVGFGISTLRYGRIVAHLLELRPTRFGFSVTIRSSRPGDALASSRYLKDVETGHGYLVRDKIYLFTEKAVQPDEILTTVLNQAPEGRADLLLGLYVGLGRTEGSAHVAGANIAYARLKLAHGSDDEAIERATLPYRDLLLERWIKLGDLPHSEELEEVHRYFRRVDANAKELGDRAIRTG